ncbi:hypothetical protein [Pseudonocardia xinjiangensis]|uniref:hypothetical protein n=1 Tax=Pseudonocardia xinjiangensis TaxID=75289 RepID=UPI001FE4EC90|nr:hypothetical protein [Pseudonocardia xinjiangensis]
MVAARIDLTGKARLARLLWLDPTSGRSEFDRLETPAKAASLGKFKLRLAHLQALDELGATERWFDGIPATKIAHFAGEAGDRRRRPAGHRRGEAVDAAGRLDSRVPDYGSGRGRDDVLQADGRDPQDGPGVGGGGDAGLGEQLLGLDEALFVLVEVESREGDRHESAGVAGEGHLLVVDRRGADGRDEDAGGGQGRGQCGVSSTAVVNAPIPARASAEGHGGDAHEQATCSD